MKPSTPLPWLQDPTGDSGPEYIGPADGPDFVTVAYKKQDAAYIVHACNAYPQLVDALRNLIDADRDTTTGAEKSAWAIAVLKDLKEIK